MSLHIDQREVEGIVILDLTGPLTLGHGDLELRDRLPALHQPGRLFLLTKLAIAIEFFNDEQDAVNSFFPDRALKRFDVLTFVEQESGASNH